MKSPAIARKLKTLAANMKKSLPKSATSKRTAGGGAGVAFAFSNSRFPDASVARNFYIERDDFVADSAAILRALDAQQDIELKGSAEVSNLNLCSYMDMRTVETAGAITSVTIDNDVLRDALNATARYDYRDEDDPFAYLIEQMRTGAVDVSITADVVRVDKNPVYSAGFTRRDLKSGTVIDLSQVVCSVGIVTDGASGHIGTFEGQQGEFTCSEDLAYEYSRLDELDEEEYIDDEDEATEASVKTRASSGKLSALAAAKKSAVTKKAAPSRASAKPSKRKASKYGPNWNMIVQRAADARLAFGYADACERAAEDDSEYNPEGPILTQAPWGPGAEITNYVPTTPADLVNDTEDSLASVGKDAVLADCAAFMAETGEDEKTYGWYFATQQMGHGVGLSDYGYDTKIKKRYLFENDNASLQIEDGRVMFYPIDSYDVKPIDVTDAVEHVLAETEDEDEATEASVKTANSGYTMTIKGGEPIDLAEVSAEDVVSALEAADMSARAQHFGSPDIVYTGDFGEVWFADWETAKGTYKEDTTPKTPLDAWCVAQLCTDKGGNTFSPAEVWIALEQRSGITTAKEATKFVKEAQSQGGFDGLSLNEGGGDPQHFHEYIGGEYSYLLDEGALSDKFSEEDVEAMSDVEKGKALLEYFFSDSTWYTDGFWMIETHPF